MSPKSRLFFKILAILWTALILVFVYSLARRVIAGSQSYSYAETSGVITSSAMEEHGASEETTYTAQIMYSYTVSGQNFAGIRISDGPMSGTRRQTQPIVDRYPAGATVKVYYDPANPSEAVLEKGISGHTFYITIVFMPFLAAFSGLWRLVRAQSRDASGTARAGGAWVIEEELRTRVRLPFLSPSAVALFGVGVSSFIAIFVVIYTAGQSPSPTFVGCVWLVILAITAALYFPYSRKVESGKYDLILDFAGSSVLFPQTLGRKEEKRVPLMDVESVNVETVERRSDNATTYVWAPALQLKSRGKPERLIEWGNRQKAEAFAAWLGEKLGAPVVLPKA